MLVLTVRFEHTQSHKLKLENFTVKSVLSTELAQNQALRLSLVTSKIICKSLYGELLEQEDESIRQYEATFIAKQ